MRNEKKRARNGKEKQTCIGVAIINWIKSTVLIPAKCQKDPSSSDITPWGPVPWPTTIKYITTMFANKQINKSLFRAKKEVSSLTKKEEQNWEEKKQALKHW